ncbi:hypothetical protein Bbelb_030000 [Branchiostoma belcheri]|nr:hypothetical protein Bbelb_030000 [Branchiostoma belcheri]
MEQVVLLAPQRYPRASDGLPIRPPCECQYFRQKSAKFRAENPPVMGTEFTNVMEKISYKLAANEVVSGSSEPISRCFKTDTEDWADFWLDLPVSQLPKSPPTLYAVVDRWTHRPTTQSSQGLPYPVEPTIEVMGEVTLETAGEWQYKTSSENLPCTCRVPAGDRPKRRMLTRLLSPNGTGRGYIPDGHRRNWDRSCKRTE